MKICEYGQLFKITFDAHVILMSTRCTAASARQQIEGRMKVYQRDGALQWQDRLRTLYFAVLCFVLLKDYVTVSFYSVWIKKLYYCHIFRSSHRTCSVRKDALRNFAKFIGKHLCPSLFFNKVAGPATLLTKRPWHRCFPVNFAKFLRTPFIQSTSRRLLLYIALYLNLAKDRQTGSRQRDFEIEKDSWNLGNGYKIWVTWQQI